MVIVPGVLSAPPAVSVPLSNVSAPLPLGTRIVPLGPSRSVLLCKSTVDSPSVAACVSVLMVVTALASVAGPLDPALTIFTLVAEPSAIVPPRRLTCV